jgi:hypothetical protein
MHTYTHTHYIYAPSYHAILFSGCSLSAAVIYDKRVYQGGVCTATGERRDSHTPATPQLTFVLNADSIVLDDTFKDTSRFEGAVKQEHPVEDITDNRQIDEHRAEVLRRIMGLSDEVRVGPVPAA